MRVLPYALGRLCLASPGRHHLPLEFIADDGPPSSSAEPAFAQRPGRSNVPSSPGLLGDLGTGWSRCKFAYSFYCRPRLCLRPFAISVCWACGSNGIAPPAGSPGARSSSEVLFFVVRTSRLGRFYCSIPNARGIGDVLRSPRFPFVRKRPAGTALYTTSFCRRLCPRGKIPTRPAAPSRSSHGLTPAKATFMTLAADRALSPAPRNPWRPSVASGNSSAARHNATTPAVPDPAGPALEPRIEHQGDELRSTSASNPCKTRSPSTASTEPPRSSGLPP